MAVTTELIEKIIQSPKAREALDNVADVYGNDYVALWMFEVSGEKIDWLNEIIEELILQLSPVTATWGLYLYEMEYNLPVNPSLPIEQRRQLILSKKFERSKMNPATLSYILEGICGFSTRIEENTGKNKFTVWITSKPFLCDESQIRKRLDSLKCSHMIYDIKYENSTYSNIYIGGVLQKYKEIELTEV